MKLVIYTHTDYLEIFKIQQEHIINIGINIENIIIFSNTKRPEYKFTTICYNENENYPSRILICLQQINPLHYEYFLFCHDNDIIISYLEDDLDIISKNMKQNNIDRVDLCVQFFDNCIIKTENNIELIKNNNFYLFSVGPSIWNFNTYFDVIQNSLHCTYRNIEPFATNYMKGKYNVYNIYSTIFKTYFGRKFINLFSWLHITSDGKITDDINSQYNNYKKHITYNLDFSFPTSILRYEK